MTERAHGPAGSFDGRTGRQVLSFDTDDPEFIRGFEAGQVWGFMGARLPAFQCYIRQPNIEMVLRMCEALGYLFRTLAEEEHGDYIRVGFVMDPGGNYHPYQKGQRR